MFYIFYQMYYYFMLKTNKQQKLCLTEKKNLP
jgi:hypothetical protein